MFGNDNQNQQDNNQPILQPPAPADSSTDSSFGDLAASFATTAPTAPPADNSFASPTDDSSDPQPTNNDADASTASSEAPIYTPSPAPAADSGATGVSDDLLGIKQSALQQLTPLVSHLDQTPEEKFKTTMMMIQATDDQTLLQSAFEAAKQITDDKARAQALLDVINEINYFTQQHKG